MTNTPDDPKAWRARLRERRRDLPAADRIGGAERLAAHLRSLQVMPAAGNVAGYWAVDGEIALHAWQLRLPPAVHYCLPLLHDDGCLRFARWRPGQPLVQNRFGIPEPDVPPAQHLPAAAMALVVMPLVGFDGQGRRLGMGAGWYDRTFAFRRERPAPPWLVGAGFSAQRVDALPERPWDVPLDAVCTERGTLMFPPGDPTPGAAPEPVPA